MSEEMKVQVEKALQAARDVAKTHPEYHKARRKMTLAELRLLGDLVEMPEADSRAMLQSYRAGNTEGMSEDELAMCQAKEKFEALCEKYRQEGC